MKKSIAALAAVLLIIMLSVTLSAIDHSATGTENEVASSMTSADTESDHDSVALNSIPVEEIIKISKNPAEIENPAATENPVPVYCLFNKRTGEYFYTISAEERKQCVQYGWADEGIAWYAPEKSDTPVYRLANPNNRREHHYTNTQKERENLVSLGWRDEGIAWYSDDLKTIPVYRHYNPRQKNGNHYYTASRSESNHIVKYEGWNYEGIAWFAAGTSEDGSKARLSSGKTFDDSVRKLHINGICNVRDLGGLHTTDGKTVRFGKIIRGSEMDGEHGINITRSGIRSLRDETGIRFDLDLRNDSEVDMKSEVRKSHSAYSERKLKEGNPAAAGPITSSPLGKKVGYLRISLKPYLRPWLSSSDKKEIAEEQKYYADAIRIIFGCVRQNKPVYVHCWAGADRTGTICFLLEGLLGVSETEMARDYEMTSVARLVGERTSDSDNYQNMCEYIMKLGGTRTLSQEGFYKFFRELGFTKGEIESFRKGMLE